MNELNTITLSTDMCSYADIAAGRSSPCHFDVSPMNSTIGHNPTADLDIGVMRKLKQKTVDDPSVKAESLTKDSQSQSQIGSFDKTVPHNRMSRLDHYHLKINQPPTIMIDGERDEDSILHNFTISEISPQNTNYSFPNWNARQSSPKTSSEKFLISETKKTRSKSPSQNANKQITETFITNENKLNRSEKSPSNKNVKCSKQDFSPTKFLTVSSKTRSISPVNRQNKGTKHTGLIKLRNVYQNPTKLTVESVRCRSISPVWIPGESASYSDIVKGNSRSNSRIPSLEDLQTTDKCVFEFDFDTKTNNETSDSRNTIKLEDEAKQQRNYEHAANQLTQGVLVCNKTEFIKNETTLVESVNDKCTSSMLEANHSAKSEGIKFTEYFPSVSVHTVNKKTFKKYNEKTIKNKDELIKISRSVNKELPEEMSQLPSSYKSKHESKECEIENSHEILDEVIHQDDTFDPAIFVDDKKLNKLDNQSISVLKSSPLNPHHLSFSCKEEQTLISSVEGTSDSSKSKERYGSSVKVQNAAVRLLTPCILSGIEQTTKSLLTVEHTRSRSKSPIWIPGQTALFSDIVKGNSHCNSRVPSLEDLTEIGKPLLQSSEIKSGTEKSPLDKKPSPLVHKNKNNISTVASNDLSSSSSSSGKKLMKGYMINEPSGAEAKENVNNAYSSNFDDDSADLSIEVPTFSSEEQVVELNETINLYSDSISASSSEKITSVIQNTCADSAMFGGSAIAVEKPLKKETMLCVLSKTINIDDKVEESADIVSKHNLGKDKSVKNKNKSRRKKVVDIDLRPAESTNAKESDITLPSNVEGERINETSLCNEKISNQTVTLIDTAAKTVSAEKTKPKKLKDISDKVTESDITVNLDSPKVAEISSNTIKNGAKNKKSKKSKEKKVYEDALTEDTSELLGDQISKKSIKHSSQNKNRDDHLLPKTSFMNMGTLSENNETCFTGDRLPLSETDVTSQQVDKINVSVGIDCEKETATIQSIGGDSDLSKYQDTNNSNMSMKVKKKKKSKKPKNPNVLEDNLVPFQNDNSVNEQSKEDMTADFVEAEFGDKTANSLSELVKPASVKSFNKLKIDPANDGKSTDMIKGAKLGTEEMKELPFLKQTEYEDTSKTIYTDLPSITAYQNNIKKDSNESGKGRRKTKSKKHKILSDDTTGHKPNSLQDCPSLISSETPDKFQNEVFIDTLGKKADSDQSELIHETLTNFVESNQFGTPGGKRMNENSAIVSKELFSGIEYQDSKTIIKDKEKLSQQNMPIKPLSVENSNMSQEEDKSIKEWYDNKIFLTEDMEPLSNEMDPLSVISGDKENFKSDVTTLEVIPSDTLQINFGVTDITEKLNQLNPSDTGDFTLPEQFLEPQPREAGNSESSENIISNKIVIPLKNFYADTYSNIVTVPFEISANEVIMGLDNAVFVDHEKTSSVFENYPVVTETQLSSEKTVEVTAKDDALEPDDMIDDLEPLLSEINSLTGDFSSPKDVPICFEIEEESNAQPDVISELHMFETPINTVFISNEVIKNEYVIKHEGVDLAVGVVSTNVENINAEDMKEISLLPQKEISKDNINPYKTSDDSFYFIDNTSVLECEKRKSVSNDKDDCSVNAENFFLSSENKLKPKNLTDENESFSFDPSEVEICSEIQPIYEIRNRLTEFEKSSNIDTLAIVSSFESNSNELNLPSTNSTIEGRILDNDYINKVDLTVNNIKFSEDDLMKNERMKKDKVFRQNSPDSDLWVDSDAMNFPQNCENTGTADKKKNKSKKRYISNNDLVISENVKASQHETVVNENLQATFENEVTLYDHLSKETADVRSSDVEFNNQPDSVDIIKDNLADVNKEYYDSYKNDNTLNEVSLANVDINATLANNDQDTTLTKTAFQEEICSKACPVFLTEGSTECKTDHNSTYVQLSETNKTNSKKKKAKKSITRNLVNKETEVCPREEGALMMNTLDISVDLDIFTETNNSKEKILNSAQSNEKETVTYCSIGDDSGSSKLPQDNGYSEPTIKGKKKKKMNKHRTPPVSMDNIILPKDDAVTEQDKEDITVDLGIEGENTTTINIIQPLNPCSIVSLEGIDNANNVGVSTTYFKDVAESLTNDFPGDTNQSTHIKIESEIYRGEHPQLNLKKSKNDIILKASEPNQKCSDNKKKERKKNKSKKLVINDALVSKQSLIQKEYLPPDSSEVADKLENEVNDINIHDYQLKAPESLCKSDDTSKDHCNMSISGDFANESVSDARNFDEVRLHLGSNIGQILEDCSNSSSINTAIDFPEVNTIEDMKKAESTKDCGLLDMKKSRFLPRPVTKPEENIDKSENHKLGSEIISDTALIVSLNDPYLATMCAEPSRNTDPQPDSVSDVIAPCALADPSLLNDETGAQVVDVRSADITKSFQELSGFCDWQQVSAAVSDLSNFDVLHDVCLHNTPQSNNHKDLISSVDGSENELGIQPSSSFLPIKETYANVVKWSRESSPILFNKDPKTIVMNDCQPKQFDSPITNLQSSTVLDYTSDSGNGIIMSGQSETNITELTFEPSTPSLECENNLELEAGNRHSLPDEETDQTVKRSKEPSAVHLLLRPHFIESNEFSVNDDSTHMVNRSTQDTNTDDNLRPSDELFAVSQTSTDESVEDKNIISGSEIDPSSVSENQKFNKCSGSISSKNNIERGAALEQMNESLSNPVMYELKDTYIEVTQRSRETSPIKAIMNPVSAFAADYIDPPCEPFPVTKGTLILKEEPLPCLPAAEELHSYLQKEIMTTDDIVPEEGVEKVKEVITAIETVPEEEKVAEVMEVLTTNETVPEENVEEVKDFVASENVNLPEKIIEDIPNSSEILSHDEQDKNIEDDLKELRSDVIKSTITKTEHEKIDVEPKKESPSNELLEESQRLLKDNIHQKLDTKIEEIVLKYPSSVDSGEFIKHEVKQSEVKEMEKTESQAEKKLSSATPAASVETTSSQDYTIDNVEVNIGIGFSQSDSFDETNKTVDVIAEIAVYTDDNLSQTPDIGSFETESNSGIVSDENDVSKYKIVATESTKEENKLVSGISPIKKTRRRKLKKETHFEVSSPENNVHVETEILTSQNESIDSKEDNERLSETSLIDGTIETVPKVQDERMSSHITTTVVQPVLHQVRKSKKVIRKVVIVNGKEHVTETVIEEPEQVISSVLPETFHSQKGDSGIPTEDLNMVAEDSLTKNFEATQTVSNEEPNENKSHITNIQGEGTSWDTTTTIFQPVLHQVRRSKKIIRNVVIVDGKEHVTETVIEEPEQVISSVLPETTYYQKDDSGISTEDRNIVVDDSVKKPLEASQKIHFDELSDEAKQQMASIGLSCGIDESVETVTSIQSEGTSSHITTTVVQPVLHQVRKSKKVIRKVVIVDGKEHVTETVIEEPEQVISSVLPETTYYQKDDSGIPTEDRNIVVDDSAKTPLEASQKIPFDELSDEAKQQMANSGLSGGINESVETVASIQSEGTSSHITTTVVQPVLHQVRKSKKVIRKVVIVDGKEHVTETVIEEPEQVISSVLPETTYYQKDDSGIPTEDRNIVVDDSAKKPLETSQMIPFDEAKQQVASIGMSGVINESVETVASIQSEGTSSHITTTVVQPVSHQLRKSKKVIRKVVIVDGKEHVTETVIEEPEQVISSVLPETTYYQKDDSGIPTEDRNIVVDDSAKKPLETSQIIPFDELSNEAKQQMASIGMSGVINESVETVASIQSEGTSSHITTTVVQPVLHQVRKSKKVIRKVVIVDGKEHVTETVIEEPEQVISSVLPETTYYQKDDSGIPTEDRNIVVDDSAKKPLETSQIIPFDELSNEAKQQMASIGMSGVVNESVKTVASIQSEGTSSHITTTVVQPVLHQVRKSKKVIRKVVIVDGKEHVTETVIEEPEQVISSVLPETIYYQKDDSGIPTEDRNIVVDDSAKKPLETSQMIPFDELSDEAKQQMASIGMSGGINESVETVTSIQSKGTSSHITTTVVQPVLHQVRKSKKVIRKVVIVDGKEHVTETVIEEPEQVISSVLPETVHIEGINKDFPTEEITFVFDSSEKILEEPSHVTLYSEPSDEINDVAISTICSPGIVETSETVPNIDKEEASHLTAINVQPATSEVCKSKKRVKKKVILDKKEPLSDVIEDRDKVTLTTSRQVKIPLTHGLAGKMQQEDVGYSGNMPVFIDNVENITIPSSSLPVDVSDKAICISELNKFETVAVDVPNRDGFSKMLPQSFIEESNNGTVSARSICPSEQPQEFSTGIPLFSEDVGTKEKNIPSKSLSLGSESSDSYYTDIQVKVTVPKELSLSVDIKQPKEKKKSKKKKKDSNKEKDTTSSPCTDASSSTTKENITLAKGNEISFSSKDSSRHKRIPDDCKSLTAQFLESEMYNYSKPSKNTEKFDIIERPLADKEKDDVTSTSTLNTFISPEMEVIPSEAERKKKHIEVFHTTENIEFREPDKKITPTSYIGNKDSEIIASVTGIHQKDYSEEFFKQEKFNTTDIDASSHELENKTNIDNIVTDSTLSVQEESDKIKNIEEVAADKHFDSIGKPVTPTTIVTDPSIQSKEPGFGRHIALQEIECPDSNVKEKAEKNIETVKVITYIGTEPITDVDTTKNIQVDNENKKILQSDGQSHQETVIESLPQLEDNKLSAVPVPKKNKKSRKALQNSKKSVLEDVSGDNKDISNKDVISKPEITINLKASQQQPKTSKKSNKEISSSTMVSDKLNQSLPSDKSKDKETKKKKSKKSKNKSDPIPKEKDTVQSSSFSDRSSHKSPATLPHFDSHPGKDLGETNLSKKGSFLDVADADEIKDSYRSSDANVIVLSPEHPAVETEVNKNYVQAITEGSKALPAILAENENLVKHENVFCTPKEMNYQLQVTTSVETGQGDPVVNIIKSPLNDITTSLIFSDNIVSVSVTTEDEKEAIETPGTSLNVDSSISSVPPDASYGLQDPRTDMKPPGYTQKAFEEDAGALNSKVLSKEFEISSSSGHLSVESLKSDEKCMSDDFLGTSTERTLNVISDDEKLKSIKEAAETLHLDTSTHVDRMKPTDYPQKTFEVEIKSISSKEPKALGSSEYPGILKSNEVFDGIFPFPKERVSDVTADYEKIIDTKEDIETPNLDKPRPSDLFEIHDSQSTRTDRKPDYLKKEFEEKVKTASSKVPSNVPETLSSSKHHASELFKRNEEIGDDLPQTIKEMVLNVISDDENVKSTKEVADIPYLGLSQPSVSTSHNLKDPKVEVKPTDYSKKTFEYNVKPVSYQVSSQESEILGLSKHPESELSKSYKEISDDLLQTIKERTLNVNTPSFVGLLSDLDNTLRRKEINYNLDLLKNATEEEKESVIVTTIILISEYLETITYIIVNSKKYDKDVSSVENKLQEISQLLNDLNMLKDYIAYLKANGGNRELLSALETQAVGVTNILDTTGANVSAKAAEKQEVLKRTKNILKLIQNLSEDIENLEKDQAISAEKKLNKLDKLEILNAEYETQVSVMFKKYPTQPDLINSYQLLSVNEELLSGLRVSLVQSQALAQEYRDMLVELENVSEVAKTIVASRVIVPSLQDLQNEMQKERKFFISLSHCRSILESLEGSLDQETRTATAKMHSRLHNIASEVLESAGERAVALALGASRWTLLEQGLAEERGWLRVAQERVPNLSGVSSSDYHQYLSLYQSLMSDIELHSARIWKLLETAHTLQGLISCSGLEESCDALRSTVGLLEDQVTENVKKLSEFKEIWDGYEYSFLRLNKWLDVVIINYTPPLDIQAFWELKAEYEVQKSVYSDVCSRFNNAMNILPVTDKNKQTLNLKELSDKWDIVNNRLEEVEVSIPSDLSSGERLEIIEARLKQMEASLNSIHDMSNEEELDLYIGKLQVLKEGAINIENELLCYGLGPSSERRKLASLQGRARTLKTQSSGEHATAVSLRERLLSLRSGMTRVARIQGKALKVLDQWEPTVDGGEDIIRQALANVKEVVKTLCDERVELSWIRDTFNRLPVGLQPRLSLINLETEITTLTESHVSLSNRAEELLALILSRLQLWDNYGLKLETVRSMVREADYMMELLRIDVGPIDLPRIVKASTRLQGVKESLTEREGGLEELRSAGQSLESVVRAEVGERLRAEVREEETAWARAEAGLVDLASRYQRAAQLWAQYRQAVSAADFPPVIDSLSLQEWEKKQEAVKQVQQLAEKIAEETGVAGILSSEVNLLARKLADAKEIITPPAEEPATQLRVQLIEAIQEKLNRVPEGSTTEKLVSLRNSLIDLGKADAKLTIASSSSSGDAPLTDLLQLWNKAFRQTFQDYHKVSSQVSETEDCTTVINLWKDYLLHVNQFLDSKLPQHYHELHEHYHLCQVHYTVLSSQKSLLPSESASFDNNTIQQLDLLTNMHNEALAKIMEKQKQIEIRISVWDKYRQDQCNLLDWLKRMEKERNQLKLRYIHSKTVGKTITKIEELLKRMAEGESLELLLKEQLQIIVPFCDESIASSLQIEQASLSHRLSNLQAALLTWKDYLEKVKSNIDNYEKHVVNVENSLDKIQNILAKENKFTVDNEDHKYLEDKLQTIMTVSSHVKELSKEVDSLEEAKDVLKDSLSPADLKSMTQRCWLFSQQQNEFEHQLAIAEHVINDRLQASKIYDQRAARFLSWLSSISHKLSNLPTDAASALSVLDRELRAEVALKRSEADWLITTGQEIGKTDTSDKVAEGWARIQESLNNTTDKLTSISKGIPKLAEEMDNVRIWLHEMETKLSAPIILKQASKKFINSKIKEHKSLQDEIEKWSEKIKNVLNLCESLLKDCELCHILLDVEAIRLATTSLEDRWKEICMISSQRKISLENLIPILEKVQRSAEEQNVWLRKLETQIDNFEKQLKLSTLATLPDIEEGVTKLVAELNDGNSGGLSILDTMYLSLHREYKLPEDMLKVPENLLKKWEELKNRANQVAVQVRTRCTDKEQWTRSAAKAVSAMAKVDALLTLVEVQESHEIEEIQHALQNESETLRQADLCGLKVMEWCTDEDIVKVQATIDEYQTLWKDINERLNKIKIQMEDECEKTLVQFEDQCVEVNTLKFETDRSTQVDTLGWSPPLARKGAFYEELIKTTEELERLLSKLSDLSHLETQAEINKCIGECESNYELAKHLSDTLMDQCSASAEEALVERLHYLGERFDYLRVCALKKQNQLRETSARGRLTCPLCSNKNWQQLDNDLWRLEQWLQYAEGSLSSQPSNPPSSIEQLEDVIQDQRELLLDLDSHRSLVVSMNIVGTHLAEHSEDEDRAKELRNRLTLTNKQWEQVCELATGWQAKLQTALMQNQEFHDTMTELTEWLEKTETSIRQAEPIDLTDHVQVIEGKYAKFKEMQEEVERCEARVRSLEEAARQVLSEDDRAVERLGRLRLRLISLSRLITSYINRLSATLGQHPPPDLSPLNLSQQLLDSSSSGNEQPTSGDEVDTSTLVRCHRFLGRVMRASLPISAFLLLLLGAASFIPVVEQDFTCANSFFYNLAPILRYPNGRPPM